MKITEQDLRERYESLETDQLIELQTRGGLTDTATRVLEQVLAERSVSTEERVAVTAEVKERLDAEAAMMASLASRGARLGARLIDFFVTDAIILVSFLLGWVAVPLGIFGVFVTIAYVVFADGLPRGQSVGKRVLGIAVVDRHTKRPCSYGESLIRNIPLLLLGIFDWLFIFSPTRQRVGDLVASTVVVRANHREVTTVEW